MSLIIFFFSVCTIIFSMLSVLQFDLMYALFYFALSILTTAIIFFCLGDSFIGSVQIIIYAGAIIVLFLFFIMMFNLEIKKKRYNFLKNQLFIKYFISTLLIFIFSFCKILFSEHDKYFSVYKNNLQILGLILFKPYIFVVECISILLLSALIMIILISKKNKILINHYNQDI